MRPWVVVMFAFGACTPECKTYPRLGGDPDSRPVPEPTCDVLTQAGCYAGEKCAWVRDEVAPTIACVPDGTGMAGQSCAYGPDGIQGYDSCVKGDVCANGVCTEICDLSGGVPGCAAGSACQATPDLFFVGGTYEAGTCMRTCDPLADNDAHGSGTRSGSACGSGEGCYGLPDDTAPTHYSCMPELHPALVHRSTCMVPNGCASDPVHALVNGCAQGYVPLLHDQTGSLRITCVAYCTPADCWLGNCPNDQLRGVPPHDCTPASARGPFAVASAGGSNGDQCVYSWSFEHTASGQYIASPTGDTVGFCIDHSQLRYDSNGNGTIDGSDAVWPRCDTLDIGSGFDAAYFGCVSTTTATAHGHPPAAMR